MGITDKKKWEKGGFHIEGGFDDFITREVEVECLPGDIPENIKVDISDLHLHQSIKAGDLIPPERVKITSDPGTVLILIELPHKEEVVAKAEGEEVIAEEKEPEVIKKERAPEEKEEEK